VQIVVDTNVFINSIGVTSPYRWIFDKIIEGEFTLCISNDIFFEYLEILERQTTSEIAKNIANFLAIMPSVKMIEPFFNWGFISQDPDDNKFVDCAISAGAECIVTHDAHFQVLKKIAFPSVLVLTPDEFERAYQSRK
jgi:uncharacterized protein